MAATVTPRALPDALRRLGEALDGLELPLEVPGADEARRVRDELVAQIGDYLVPRLEQMDAPLLLVVGGSTGAGKSTLVNSLVGATVSASGVLRPTTRAPVLVCHAGDLPWFEDRRVLPELAAGDGGRRRRAACRSCRRRRCRPAWPCSTRRTSTPSSRPTARWPASCSPPPMRWLFVTTAARYADAVPWDLLSAARERGTSLCLVLNRVPPGAGPEIVPHLHQMLDERGLGGTEVLVVPETALEDERLPAADLAPVRTWLDALGASAEARARR